MALDNAKNFALATVSTGYNAAATSIALTAGHGAKLPSVSFNAVWWNFTDYSNPSDDPNVEIVRVTAISTDTLTITRAQEGTSASTKNTGGKTYKLLAGLTALGANAVVTGPSSAVDNEIARFDGTGGKTIQGYTSGGPTVSDTGAMNIGGGSIVSTAQLIIKALTGASYNLFLEGTGGVVIPTMGLKHSSDTTGVAFTGNDAGFGFSNIAEGPTLFMVPGYPDAYWKTHGSLAAIFHFQSHNGSSYLDSHVIKGGLNAFGHAAPDRLMHPEIADAVTNAVSYAMRMSHVSSGTVANGFGVGQEIELENGSGTNRVIAALEYLFTDVTNASEDADWVLKLMAAGTLAEKFRVTSAGVVELITGANIRVNSANAKRTLILTAAGGAPTTTAGCSAVTQVESATNDVNYFVLDFDTATSENAFWTVQMPDNYDGSTLTARFIWTNAAGLTTQTVRWGIKARAYTDSDAIDQAWGTEVTVDDTWLAQLDVHISAATSAITPSGSPAGGQLMAFNVARKTASDNLTGDARLIAVHIEYGINAYSD